MVFFVNIVGPGDSLFTLVVSRQIFTRQTHELNYLNTVYDRPLQNILHSCLPVKTWL